MRANHDDAIPLANASRGQRTRQSGSPLAKLSPRHMLDFCIALAYFSHSHGVVFFVQRTPLAGGAGSARRPCPEQIFGPVESDAGEPTGQLGDGYGLVDDFCIGSFVNIVLGFPKLAPEVAASFAGPLIQVREGLLLCQPLCNWFHANSKLERIYNGNIPSDSAHVSDLLLA